MSTFTKADAVRVLMNLDTLAAAEIPETRRAWAHLFIAMGLLQKVLPNPEQLTRERFMECAGKIHDYVYRSLGRGLQS